MKYKDAIRQSMNELAKDSKVIFIGYNTRNGSRAYGTLSDISKERCLETPVAENLMTGLAIGLSLEGFKPVLFFERHDFMLIALDALVNHLDKLKRLSNDKFKSSIIIRATVGGTVPIYPGIQHDQDFTYVFKQLFKYVSIEELRNANHIIAAYKEYKNFKKPVIMIERKDLFEKES